MLAVTRRTAACRSKGASERCSPAAHLPASQTFIPKVASRLYTVQLDLMEVALTRTVSFCRKLVRCC